MREEGAGPDGWPVVVRVPVEPVEAAIEADARDAAVRNTRRTEGLRDESDQRRTHTPEPE
ncbi:hypothetical protein [Streptomyces sp. NPDC056399]|uniref:hypothetical protein n=1 Tax=Streptomyces sp. NPDC056399 TaxID=3345807 RepID=UPI0035DC5B69